jgi:hypothetical protein
MKSAAGLKPAPQYFRGKSCLHSLKPVALRDSSPARTKVRPSKRVQSSDGFWGLGPAAAAARGGSKPEDRPIFAVKY